MPVEEVLDQLCAGGKAVDWPWITWVTHLSCPGDAVDEGGGHYDRLAFKPCMKRVIASYVDVGLEFMDQFHNRRMVILNHVHPPLGV
jgi:hypothetical protein